jgi:hypothetical protein
MRARSWLIRRPSIWSGWRVRTKDLELETGVCQAETTVDYSLARLNSSEFLLPAATRLQIVNANGGVKDNLTIFSACHEFRGESTVSFGSPEDVPAAISDVPRGRSAGTCHT